MLYIALSFKSEVCGDIHVWRWAPTRSSPLSLLHLFWVGCLTLVQIISKTSASISIFHECESNINKNGIRPHNLKIKHFWQKQLFFSESPYPLERKNTNFSDMLSLKIRFKGASWHTDWHHGSAGTHFTYRVPTCLLQPSHPLGFLTPLSPLPLHMVFRKAVYLHFLILGMLHFFSKSRFFYFFFQLCLSRGHLNSLKVKD